MSYMSQCYIEAQENKDPKASALWAIAAGLFAVADATRDAARHLGNGDATSSMGAIEAFGKHIGEKLDDLTMAISDLKEE